MLLSFLIQAKPNLSTVHYKLHTLSERLTHQKKPGADTFTGDFLLLAQKLMTICGENFTGIMRKWKMKVRFKIKQIMDGQN